MDHSVAFHIIFCGVISFAMGMLFVHVRHYLAIETMRLDVENLTRKALAELDAYYVRDNQQRGDFKQWWDSWVSSGGNSDAIVEKAAFSAYCAALDDGVECDRS